MSSPVRAREWEKTLTVKCRLCGGNKCKRCSESAALAKTDTPVTGLHADWVADRILGMMRPSSRLMKEYNIAQQFHKLRIAAVFNLTLPGEHPYCGDGLVGSGFPYDPEKDLMAEKIRFYNFGWEDMTIPTLSFMLDIAKVMASVLQDGHSNIAVHCHAGYGRTGLAIACCLIFMHNIPPDRAIKIVRRDRPGSIQTSAQAKFVREFHEYINAARVVFALPLIHDRFTVADMIEEQNRIVHGEKHAGSRVALPCILDFLCREVEAATEQNGALVTQAFVFHTQWQGHDGRHTVLDAAELQDKHNKAVLGDTFAISMDSQLSIREPSVEKDPIPPPVPVPAAPATGSYVVCQEDLFPVKVAFNVGDWNWGDAASLAQSPAVAPALLLDWLEHLAEPLLSTDLVAQVATQTLETAVSKWRPLNHQPSYMVRSLDRVLSCLKLILKKAEASNGLVDALCIRSAMALFHLKAVSTPVPTLVKHGDFVKQLLRGWQPPKRLELNFESLQKFTKPTLRRLSHVQASHDSMPPASASPTRTVPEVPSFEPALHTKLHLTGDRPASPKLRDTGEHSPRWHEALASSPSPVGPHPHAHSPSHHHPRPPVELPPMVRDKEEQTQRESPVKSEPLIPRLVLSAELRKEPEADPENARRTPTPPPGDAERPSSPPPAHPVSPPPLSRGHGSGTNLYSLPSVKVGERYRNRQVSDREKNS